MVGRVLQQVLNALVLVGCDGGGFQKQRSKNEELSYVLNLGMREIDRVKERFVMEGLEAALSGRNHNRLYRKKANCEF